MIHEELEAAINEQINQELTASYNYLGMSTYFDVENLDGFANWMMMQSDEEKVHAMRLLQYLQDRGGKVVLNTIPSPETGYSNPLQVFKKALDTEIENTRSINKLYELALKLNDHATKSHLQWFLDEQVEEEKSIEDIIALLDRIGDDSAGLLYLNDKLGSRKAEAEA
ncbi:ferritin [Verrucomicrobiaceae bacterium R5-34]|uniref:Ferritin n=1 Tax=Oceaniferula flava TaxID=2800421 RepID=A0AAE2SDB9_9BACT|nr:ferritin [Oceaniferula flavus]MBK1832257.1 ferritin [Verrucomicrobiaceae bacterium R5-34]MBK1854897.1 ferritin [Oceaniferula flavus]MBM1136203.1 ferritin [Oceaniferula flavus]